MNHILRCRCIDWSEEHGCCSERKERPKIPPMPPVKPPHEITMQEEIKQLREENKKLKAIVQSICDGL